MSYLMPLFESVKIERDTLNIQNNVDRAKFGSFGGLVSKKMGKASGTAIYQSACTVDSYIKEAQRIIGDEDRGCIGAMGTFYTLCTESLWSELDKDLQTRCTIQYTHRDGKSTVNADYVTRLRLSLYTCIEQAPERELEILRIARKLDRCFDLYNETVNLLKKNDGEIKARQVKMEKIDRINQHDNLMFATSEQTTDEPGESGEVEEAA